MPMSQISAANHLYELSKTYDCDFIYHILAARWAKEVWINPVYAPVFRLSTLMGKLAFIFIPSSYNIVTTNAQQDCAGSATFLLSPFLSQ